MAIETELMRRCLALGREAGRRGEAPVGSLVAHGGGVVAEASESVAGALDVAGHAEIIALRRASAALGRLDLSSCLLVTTAEPCLMCAYAIREAKIGRVVIGTAIPELGGVTSRLPVLTAAMPGWAAPPAITWSVLGAECAELLGTRVQERERERDRPRPPDGGETMTEHAITGSDETPQDRAQIRPASLDLATADRLAYAYGVRTDRLVWIAGQVARDGQGRLVGAGDAEAQAVQCFENVKAVVEAAGGTMADLVRVNMYVTERPFREAVNTVRARYFTPPRLPVGTLLIVAGLALPEYLVEVDAVAVLRR